MWTFLWIFLSGDGREDDGDIQPSIPREAAPPALCNFLRVHQADDPNFDSGWRHAELEIAVDFL